MQVLIDNGDGQGSLDYTGCLQLGPLCTIVRELNKPSLCSLLLFLGANGRKAPVEDARVAVCGTGGVVLFAGTVIAAPGQLPVGEGFSGPAFATLISAVSDEVLLNANVSSVQTTLLGETAQESWTALNALSAVSGLTLALSEQLSGTSRVEVEPGAKWADLAKALGDSTRTAYRVVANNVQVSDFGQVVYSVAAGDPGLLLEAVATNDLRWLASDVTVCGREEPTAYVTEVFAGDGSTTTFSFAEKHFSPVAKQKTSITDLFQGESLNSALWDVSDSAATIALTASGLTCTGGTGRDASATIASVQQIEMGGVITLEGDGIQIGDGSAGSVLGFYTGSVAQANCFAAFAVNSTAGPVSVMPQVNGNSAGAAFQVQSGHLYTFRLRVYVPETERVRQSYAYLGAVGTAMGGGEAVVSGGWLEFEVQDVTSGTPGVPTILFSAAVSAVPPICVAGVLDSGNLSCSVKSFSCTQSAPLWVSIGGSGAVPEPQFLASAVDGGACKITTAGQLTFYPGNIPADGTFIYANYRLSARSIARRVAASGSVPATEMWIGSVTAPIAWSSVDCDNAAAALLNIASNSTAAVKGTYTNEILPGMADIWPGDALEIGPYPQGSVTSGIVREVKFGLLPGGLHRAVRFANDWAESVSIRLSSTVPQDAVLPQQPLNIASALQSLSGLTITAVTGTTVSFNTGPNAPVNGGFEVRRRDDTFGPGADSDLVLRSATGNITIPRLAPVEQYYVRMYDGASPPNYSLHSAAVFINVPL